MRNSDSPTTQPSASPARERQLRVERFGAYAELRVQPGPGHQTQAQVRLDRAASLLERFDRTLSRFDPDSELCALNADPRGRVPATPLMLRFAEAVGWAGRRSGGLVDATCLPDVERAGYRSHLTVPMDGGAGTASFEDAPLPALGAALHQLAVVDRDAHGNAPRHHGGWRDVAAGTDYVERPVGVRLDSGGIGKGLAADLAGEVLRGAPAWVVDCGGDLRIGGTAGIARAVEVRDPIAPSNILHRLFVTRGGVATSGVTRRSWTAEDGVQRHHLIDPRTGEPADTGVLQVTALAPSALEAEVLAKTALLAGPEEAHARLEHGGVVVCASGLVVMVPAPSVRQRPLAQRRRAAFTVPGQRATTRTLGAR